MKMKISELNPPELDYWVAKAEGFEGPCDAWKESNLGSAGGPVLMKSNDACSHEKCYASKVIETIHGVIGGCPEFSTDWSQGGPIIEREHIELTYTSDWPDKGQCTWETSYKEIFFYSDSPLIAAMRAYVASKYGEEIETET